MLRWIHTKHEGTGPQREDTQKLAKPDISLFTQPHSRGRRGGGKYASFFREMKWEEIKLLPDDLQEKQSVAAYVPNDIRGEFVFRTNPDDGKRYVARLPEEKQVKVKRNNAPKTQAKATKAPAGAVKATVPNRPNPPKAFDSND